MAKHFSEIEKQRIKQKLLKEGKQLFEEYGIKKTSVDKIVEKVGIAKGSFYNFYPSKESMVFDLLMQAEEQLHDDEMENLYRFLKEYEYPEALKYTIWLSIKTMQKEPLLLMHSDPAVIYQIWSKIDEKEKERGVFLDQKRVDDFMNVAKQRGYKMTQPESVLKASLMSFFMIVIHQDMVGESGQEALELIMKSTIQQLFVKAV